MMTKIEKAQLINILMDIGTPKLSLILIIILKKGFAQSMKNLANLVRRRSRRIQLTI
jgi:hypothetical protein